MERTRYWCPACNEGWAEQVSIRPGALRGYLCNECEAFWEAPALPEKDLFTQFSLWLEEKGLEAISIDRLHHH